jgi:hypothetical protein
MWRLTPGYDYPLNKVADKAPSRRSSGEIGRRIVMERSKGAVGPFSPTFPPSKADGNGRGALDFGPTSAGQRISN